MDENLRNKLLNSFPDTELKGVIREYDSGRSGSSVFAVRFHTQHPHGLNGTYIVKIGAESWAANEQAFYAHPSTSALTPLLAHFHMSSQTIDNMTAVAYNVAFDSLMQPRPLMSILDKGSQSESEARKQIRDLSYALVNWHLASDLSKKSIVSDPYSLLYRMLGQRRMNDMKERLGTYLPFWERDVYQISVEGLSTRLPNPLAYLHREAWSKIGYNPHCPIGWIHGDLHTENIICFPKAKVIPKVIDFGQSVPDGVPFFDLAYLEFDILRHLLPVEQADNREQWLSLLDVSMASVVLKQRPRQGWQATRAWKLIQPIRQQVNLLLQVDPESYEIVWWLATIAVGLNFARKGREERLFDRMSALLYAAYGLNRLFNILHVDELIGEYIPIIRWVQGPSPQSSPFMVPSEHPGSSQDKSDNTHQDWGNAPDISVFFGRTEELTTLEQWIARDRCQLVAIVGLRGVGKTRLSVKLGKGGTGKTDLSLKLAKDIQNQFEYVIWRSLLSAPKLKGILTGMIEFLSDHQDVNVPDTVDSQISRLLSYLQQHRCLVILDNVETILQGGYYREGYEEYGRLFKQAGEIPHQSCMLLTSREKPPEIVRLDGKTSSVRSLELGGLNYLDAKKIFSEIASFSGSDDDWRALNGFYNGNPLALELAARHISDVFFGSIAEFLKEGKPVFADLRGLLDWHFDRLTDPQKEIMYWLAINGEPISLSELKEDIASPVAKAQVPSTLQHLQHLIPLERSPSRFTLQPVLIEYMTERLVEQVVEEIRIGKLELFNKIPLVMTQSKEYIRESQTRMILGVVLTRLQEVLSKDEIESHLNTLLSQSRGIQRFKSGYAGGNIFNLLNQIQVDLSNYDFSNIAVWQGNFQGFEAHNINLTKADLKGALFTETFGIVLCGIFNPQQDLIAVSANNGEVYAWRIADKKQIFKQSAQNHWAKAVAFSSDGALIASGGTNFVRVFTILPQRKLLKEQYINVDRILALQFSPDGRLLVCGFRDQLVSVWDIDTGACIATLPGHNGSIMSAKFSTEGNLLVTGSADRTVRVWDIVLQNCLHVLHGHENAVRDVTISEDNRLVASGSEDRTVRVWDLPSERCIAKLSGHTARVSAVAFSPDHRRLASGSEDTTIRFWDIHKISCIGTLIGHTNWVLTLGFSTDGRQLVSGGEDRTVRVWTLSQESSESETTFFNAYCDAVYRGYMNRPFAIACSPDGKHLASGWEDGMIRIWDIPTGNCLKTLRGHTGWIRSLAFSADGHYLASAGVDCTIRSWNTSNWLCTRELVGDVSFESVAFAPDGSKLAGSSEHVIQMWFLAVREEARTFEGHADLIRHIEFDSTGETLVSCSDDGTIRLWDVMTGKCRETLREHANHISSFTLNADWSLLATGSEDRTVKIWDVSNRICVKTLHGHDSEVWAVSLTPDGALLASGGQDLTVRLWDVNVGQCRWIARGHQDIVWKTAITPNGKILASASYDETIKYWDIETGECLSTLRAPRPYSGMNITEATSLTLAQKETLKMLGAIEGL